MSEIRGQCLCGAVTVTAEIDKPVLRACHCDMCRQHASVAFMSIKTIVGSERIEGATKSYRSSQWAERGFCPECGSTLWYGTVGDGVKNFSAGLFKDAAGAPLVIEFFADNCPAGYGFSGGHKKLDQAETIKLFTEADT